MYHTGVVGSLADLLTAIQGACTGEGWTLDGNVLYKGDCYVSLSIVSTYLSLQGGTGQSSGTLSGASTDTVRLGTSLGGASISYPVTYHAFIFADPDEVFVVANYSTDLYQHLAFGMSNVPDLPGNGTWFFASCNTSSSYMAISPGGGGSSAGGAAGGQSPLLFWRNNNETSYNVESYIHHGLDSLTWSGQGPADRANALSPQAPLMACLPNTWNDETVLVPINVFVPRAGAKVSLVADIQNARYCRINYHDPEDVLTLGPDEWMIFPAYRKDDTDPDAGSGITHTGTMAVAYRYEP